MNPLDTFLSWEKTTRDTIDFKCIYVDMAGDLVSGLLLSQIVYWNLPSQAGQTKLRVKKDGHLWLAKNRDDWWEEIRITPKQVDRAIKILSDKGLVVYENSLFAGKRTPFIRIDSDGFMAAWNTQTEIRGEDRYLPLGNIGVDQRVTPITESTAESTTVEGHAGASVPSTQPAVEQPVAIQDTRETHVREEGREKEQSPITPARACFGALAKICAIDLTDPTDKQRGMLNQESSRLRKKLGATADNILHFGQYWQEKDWRGKQGEHPRPVQVREEWGKFERWRKTTKTVKHSMNSDPQVQAFKALRQQMEGDNGSNTSERIGRDVGSPEPQGAGDDPGGPRRTFPGVRRSGP